MPTSGSSILTLRLSPQAKKRIVAAAEQLNRTVSEFVLTSALARADEVLAEQRAFVMSSDKWEKFQAALDAPPCDIPRLHRLMQEPSIFEKGCQRVAAAV
jgi:uncharacterized protein (DUF1778 family)